MSDRITWMKGVSRRETPIRSELIARGASKYVVKILGVSDDNFLFILDNGNATAYFDSLQIKAMGEVIASEAQKNPEYLKNHISQLIESSNNLVKLSKEIGSGDFQNLNMKQLKKKFDLFIEIHFKFSPYMMIPIAIEKVITNIVKESLLKTKTISKDKNKLDFYLSKLIIPSKLNQMVLEIQDFEKIVNQVKFNKDGNHNNLLESHSKKYGWLAVYSPSDKAYSLNYFKNKLREEINLKQKTIKEKSMYKDPIELANELGLSKEIKFLLELLREYVYLRTYRLEQLSKSYFFVQPLFKEMAKRANVSLYELCLCSIDEIEKYLSGGKLPLGKEINARKKKYLYVIKHGNFNLYSGKEADKVIKEEIGEGEILSAVKAIKGTPTSLGVGRGRVHIILDKKEILNFQTGEVLITTMTNPDFVIIMKKAVAIVTDEGGVLCHAAILSRELGIPCITGTRMATKVFKDGDLVEIDTSSGIVKKID